MALVCPIRLDHILNVPVGSMRSIDLFIKVQGCLPKRLFMPINRLSAKGTDGVMKRRFFRL